MNEHEKSAIIEVTNKAKEKLITAKINYANQRYEDAASRAYYCVFHIISAESSFSLQTRMVCSSLPRLISHGWEILEGNPFLFLFGICQKRKSLISFSNRLLI